MSVETLLERVSAGDFKIGIVGLGRVGLPLGIAFANKGIAAIGIDRDEELLAKVRDGVMPFQENGGECALKEALANHKLTASSDFEDLKGADVIFITVATGLNNEQRVDYSQLRSALAGIAPWLHADQVLVLRSTVSPGTLEKVVKPFIQEHTDLAVGSDLLLASAPERIAAGHALEELQTLPEIVGGLDEPTTEIVAAALRALNPDKVVHKTNPVSAELAKLYTNVYRYVRFAVANEFALLAEHYERDAHDIIGMINGEYPRGGIPMPGPCGGPCLAKDGYLLVEELSFPDFILTAWKLNEAVPAHMVGRLKTTLALKGKTLSGSRVGVLGMAFKADIDDLRQSPALRISELLVREGAIVTATDPFNDSASVDDALRDADAVVLATNHSDYRDMKISDLRKKTKPDCVFIDCWAQWADAEPDEQVITFGKAART